MKSFLARKKQYAFAVIKYNHDSQRLKWWWLTKILLIFGVPNGAFRKVKGLL